MNGAELWIGSKKSRPHVNTSPQGGANGRIILGILGVSCVKFSQHNRNPKAVLQFFGTHSFFTTRITHQ